jgi:hypothetical protein
MAISRLGWISANYLMANFLRQISFNQIEKFNSLHWSSLIISFMWIKQGVTYEEGCGAAGTRF